MPLPAWVISQDAHPLPDLAGSRLHLLGLGGRGLSALAVAARALGADVDGCDPAGYPRSLALLADRGIEVLPGHDPAHLADGRRLVATALAPTTGEEVEAARRLGVLHRRMDLVAAVMAARPGVGVTGSHGKGTVSALTAAALREAGQDPLIVLGVEAPQLGGAVHAGAGPAVMEVDESDLAAHFVACEVAVVVNLDDDHPHLLARLPEVADSVGGFVAQARRAVVLGPSPRQDALAGRARVPVWRVGREVTARVARETPEGTVVRLRGPGPGERVETLIRLAGAGTAANAATAYAAARAMGAGAEAAAHGLSAIDRLDRRLEPLGVHGGTAVYDDFGGKHPANVRGGIATLRRRHPRARLIAIFEPVQGLTVAHWGWRYARALREADAALILPIYDHPSVPVSSTPELERWFHDAGPPLAGVATLEEAAREAVVQARPGDVIVGFMQMTQRGRDLGAMICAALDDRG